MAGVVGELVSSTESPWRSGLFPMMRVVMMSVAAFLMAALRRGELGSISSESCV